MDLKATISSELKKCKRCTINDAVIKVRNDNMCSDCFNHYIRTKFVKRMEPFRVRNAKDGTRKLLVPISMGAASTTLLSLLDWQLQSQVARTGRTGFDVLAVYIDHSCLDTAQPSAEHLKILEKHFSMFEYRAIRLERIYEYQKEDDDTVPPIEESAYVEEMQSLISSLPTRNSQIDIIDLLRTRLLVGIAKKEDCDTILYGDTTTRLAEKTLVETAKGRGRSIPWQISDGPTPYGVATHYPLREILRKELEAYVNTTGLRELCLSVDSSTTAPPNPKTSRHLTIDQLATHYFSEIEKMTPSIVANVVRTAGKLVTPNTAIGQDCCEVCGLPKDADIDGWVKDENQDDRIWSMIPLDTRPPEDDKFVVREKAKRCYGCRRTTLGAEGFKWPLP